MKTLVIGASGLLGHNLFCEFAALGEVVGTFHTQQQDGLIPLDLSQPQQIERVITEFRPDTILLPGAMTNVDACEENEVLSRAINLDGTCCVANAAEQIGARLVYFSTDYVFDGESGPYQERDATRPLGVYARHKLAAENFVRDTVGRHLVIRTCQIYGWEAAGKNFVLQVLRRLRAGERVKVFTDQFGTPTYAPNLAEATRALIEVGTNGLFHAAGSELVSRIALGKTIARTFGLDESLLDPIPSAQVLQKAKRPHRSGLRIEKLTETIPTKMLSLTEGLALMCTTPEKR